MNRLYINQAAETPEVLFEPEQGTLRFKGNSHPEDARAFYDPIRNIIATYLETKNERELRVDFYFRYINSASTKFVREIILTINKYFVEGKHKISMSWFYDDDDIDMLEQGEDLFEDVNFPFELKTY